MDGVHVADRSYEETYYYTFNQNYNKILESDWLSTGPIWALIGQFNWTEHVMPV